mmetsp:Transcript_130324/g.325046  ORF Transcript_130324/g.325046 Transcript_130324/m.325046 type:complete len:254 (-) Transcript_130324:701-1462(-)
MEHSAAKAPKRSNSQLGLRGPLDVESASLHVAELAILLDVAVGAADPATDLMRALRNLVLGDRHHVDCVRPIGNAQCPHVCPHTCQRRVLTDPMCAVHLDGVINDLQRRAWSSNLDHSDVRLRCLEAHLVSHDCCQVAQLPALGDLDPCFSDGDADAVLLSKNAPESLPAVRPVHHGCKCQLRLADGPHAMVDPAGTQPALRDLETAPFAEKHVFLGDAHIVEDDLSMVVFLAEDGQWSQDIHTWRIPRHKDH